jgi:hypothetical protein
LGSAAVSAISSQLVFSQVILTKSNTNHYTFLEPRKVVRIIGKEEQDIPLLASVSEKEFVKEAQSRFVYFKYTYNKLENGPV